MRTVKKKSLNRSTGAVGEEFAAQYLLNRGDEILARNWRIREGCHRLIGERAAEIVTSVADAMEFLSPM